MVTLGVRKINSLFSIRRGVQASHLAPVGVSPRMVGKSCDLRITTSLDRLARDLKQEACQKLMQQIWAKEVDGKAVYGIYGLQIHGDLPSYVIIHIHTSQLQYRHKNWIYRISYGAEGNATFQMTEPIDVWWCLFYFANGEVAVTSKSAWQGHWQFQPDFMAVSCMDASTIWCIQVIWKNIVCNKTCITGYGFAEFPSRSGLAPEHGVAANISIVTLPAAIESSHKACAVHSLHCGRSEWVDW